MIQRKQTIWLLSVIVLIIASAFIPYAHKSLIDAYGKASLISVTTKDSEFGAMYISLITAATLVMALLCIFSFKNRKIQKIFALVGVVFSIGLAILEFTVGSFSNGNFAITFGIALPIICSFLFIKAYADINADDKLVRSIDRLRD